MQHIPASDFKVTRVPAGGASAADFRAHVPTRLRFFFRSSLVTRPLYYVETPSFPAAATLSPHLLSPPIAAGYSAGVLYVKLHFRPGGTPGPCAGFEIYMAAKFPELPPGQGYMYEAVAVIQDEVPMRFSVPITSIVGIQVQLDTINVYVRLEGASAEETPSVVDWFDLAARNVSGKLELHPLLLAFLQRVPRMRTATLDDAARRFPAADVEQLRLALYALR